MCAGVMPLLGLDTFNAVGSALPNLFEFRVGDYRVMLVVKGKNKKITYCSQRYRYTGRALPQILSTSR